MKLYYRDPDTRIRNEQELQSRPARRESETFSRSLTDAMSTRCVANKFPRRKRKAGSRTAETADPILFSKGTPIDRQSSLLTDHHAPAVFACRRRSARRADAITNYQRLNAISKLAPMSRSTAFPQSLKRKIDPITRQSDNC